MLTSVVQRDEQNWSDWRTNKPDYSEQHIHEAPASSGFSPPLMMYCV